MYDVRREPPLSEILRDPLTRLLMARDGVDEASLRRLLRHMSQRLKRMPERVVA
jgi:hypothetical protein